MTQKQWDEWLQKKMSEASETLKSKEGKYATNNDRFHNFNVCARVNNTDPINEVWNHAGKHLAVIIDMMEAIKEQYPLLPQEDIEEAFKDMRNYLFLAEAMITERLSPNESPTA